MERHTYVVSWERDGHGTVNKLIKVERKTEVLERAKHVLAARGDFRVEYFYEPCDMFVEVDALDELPDSGKIRLIPVSKSPGDRSGMSTATTLPVAEIEHLSEFGDTVFLTESPVMSFPASTSSVDPLNVTARPAEEEHAIGSNTSDIQEVAKEQAQSSQRKPFRLDSSAVDGGLLEAVRTEAKLEKKDRVRLIDAVYNQYIVEQKTKYVRSGLDSLAADVAEQFPGLFYGIHLNERLGLVKQMLTNKFKNKRRVDSSDEVLSKKRQKQGLANYLPKDEEADGAGEMRRQMRTGLLEGSKLTDAMNATFPDRRVMVVKKKVAIPALKDMYPALFSETELWNELARIRDEGQSGREELEAARECLRGLLDKCMGSLTLGNTDEALDHVLYEVRERQNVFGYSKLHPCIYDNGLHVEGVEAVKFELFNKRTDQFLSWACAFTVFAQRLTFRPVENAAYIGCVRLLRTDARKPPAFVMKRLPNILK